eukprot:CAMPEP_0183704074 /NCGR_PEP_ID=MMETSP0737-20130205/1542_1 /TAXON_ID=385413 /ORGANISM="Thalassiosira miniscula, Strain CCMP1093" /LENGTH=742 /DNA_ID=CAMNT_0025930889 /DNA_START=312 /DNA_END=2543 /DNA_ORIENTATION=+
MKARRGHDENSKTTRVDGKGLWRSWKRNFKTKLLALLDLIDNSLDAAIQCTGKEDRDHNTMFVGRVHVYPDVYRASNNGRVGIATTGLCIVNNCVKEIRPLEKVLEVYNSSKVDSGAGDIGENGVGLKQGCATLSDLSFILVKNGSNDNIELGLCAESLQKEEGCYLPAFKFSNQKGPQSLSLKDQMISLFSQPKHADVAHCIKQYGAAFSGSCPNLFVGIERLCKHFDRICCDFYYNRYVFMVILDKVHHGQTEEYIQSAYDAQHKITVQHLMKELANEIPRTYLHIPNSFDFTIGDKKVEFQYWPERLVELTAFTINVNTKISWQQKFDQANDNNTYSLRVFIGFDGMRITDRDAGKEASLYFYSRQSGRLICHSPDARTLLGLSAGGTTFCQGLTIIIDDIGGNLPLNPTKQEVAFGEETHGIVHEGNLMAWVGSVVHFYYQHHLNKFDEKKKVLTKEIAKFGDLLIGDHRRLRILDNSDLTTYRLAYKSTGKSIRVDKSSVKEIVGDDTLYRLVAGRNQSTKTKASDRGASGRKRKATKSESKAQASKPQKIPRRSKPRIAHREAESESDGEIVEGNDGEIVEGNDGESDSSASQSLDKRDDVQRKTKPTKTHENIKAINPPKVPPPPSQNGLDSESELEDGEVDEEADINDSNAPSKENDSNREVEGITNPDAPVAGQVDNDDFDYHDICVKLTEKTNSQRAHIKSLKHELAEERKIRIGLEQQIQYLQEKIYHQIS